MSPDHGKGETRIEEPTPAERSIARRVAEARATVPQLELSADVQMDAALELHARHGWSITAMVARACALALRETPRANSAYRDGRFELYSRVNVGVVIDTEDGYLVPTVIDADHMPLEELSREIEQLVRLAREGQLRSAAVAGATFTISNLGESGVGIPSIITSLGQAAALAAGAIREAAIARAGQVLAGHLMTITLVCDQRILYGARAGRFLSLVHGALEDPRVLEDGGPDSAWPRRPA